MNTKLYTWGSVSGGLRTRNTKYPPLGEVSPSADEIRDTIIVQGIIDLLVKTPEGLVVIDFKTDDVSAESALKRAAIYRQQLDLYAQAASIILNQKTGSKWLYFLRPGCEVEV